MLKFLFVCEITSSIWEGFVNKFCESQYRTLPSKTSNEEVIQSRTLHIFLNMQLWQPLLASETGETQPNSVICQQTEEIKLAPSQTQEP